MGNNRVSIIKTKVLSQAYNPLVEYDIEVENRQGAKEILVREVYEKDSGATVLLYNLDARTVILTKQFRLPIFINEQQLNKEAQHDGMAIEACAGLLEGLSPEATVIKEALEETGYEIENPEFLFEAYMVPGTVTEKVYFFIAPYTSNQKISAGGGLATEGEDIEILEIDFNKAYQMIAACEITDAKTIMLLQYMKIRYFS